jgi:hypothetical protein
MDKPYAALVPALSGAAYEACASSRVGPLYAEKCLLHSRPRTDWSDGPNTPS